MACVTFFPFARSVRSVPLAPCVWPGRLLRRLPPAPRSSRTTRARGRACMGEWPSLRAGGIESVTASRVQWYSPRCDGTTRRRLLVLGSTSGATRKRRPSVMALFTRPLRTALWRHKGVSVITAWILKPAHPLYAFRAQTGACCCPSRSPRALHPPPTLPGARALWQFSAPPGTATSEQQRNATRALLVPSRERPTPLVSSSAGWAGLSPLGRPRPAHADASVNKLTPSGREEAEARGGPHAPGPARRAEICLGGR